MLMPKTAGTKKKKEERRVIKMGASVIKYLFTCSISHVIYVIKCAGGSSCVGKISLKQRRSEHKSTARRNNKDY